MRAEGYDIGLHGAFGEARWGEEISAVKLKRELLTFLIPSYRNYSVSMIRSVSISMDHELTLNFNSHYAQAKLHRR